MTIETKELKISEELKRKVEMVCRFANVKYTIINGNIKSIKNTNIAMIKPHIVKIKSIDYLIFDESTSMLDINGKNDIYKLIKKLKKEIGIICITNNMEELIYADEIIIIDNKKAFKYDINDILNNTTILKEHNLDIPFIFKIANKLNIKNIKDVNEEYLLRKIGK